MNSKGMIRLFLACVLSAQYALGLPLCQHAADAACLPGINHAAASAAVPSDGWPSFPPRYIHARAGVGRLTGIGSNSNNAPSPGSNTSRPPGSNNPNAPEGESSNQDQSTPETSDAGDQHDVDFFEKTANDISDSELQRLDSILPLNGLSRRDLGRAMLSGRQVRADHMTGKTKKNQDGPFIDWEALEKVGLERSPEDPADPRGHFRDAQGRTIFHRTLIKDTQNPNFHDSPHQMPFEFHISPERGQIEVNKGFTNRQLGEANIRQTDLIWSEWAMICQVKGINPNSLRLVRRREITAQMNRVTGTDGQTLNINTEASISEIVKRLSPTKERGNFQPVKLRPYGTPGVTHEEGAYFDLISSSLHVDRVYKLLDDHPSLGDKTITEIKVISKEHSPQVERQQGDHLEIVLGPKDSVRGSR